MAQSKDFRMTTTFAVRDMMSPAISVMKEKWDGFAQTLDSTSFKRLERSFDAMNRHIASTVDAASGLAERLAVPFGAVSAAVGAITHKAVFGFTESGDALDKMSQRVGVSVERLQELSFAAVHAGGSSEMMEDALKTLNEKIAEVAGNDNEELGSLFEKLGISVKDAEGKLRSAADIMPEFADAIQRNEDVALRTKMAIAAFGDEAGVGLIPLLSQGSEGLREMSDQAHKLGAVMSEEDTKAAALMSDHFYDFRVSVDGVTNSIGAKLAPTVIRVTDRLRDMVAGNREAFSDRFVAVADKFVASIEQIDFEGLVNGFINVADAVLWTFDKLGGFETVLYGLGAVMGGKILGSMWSLGTAVVGLGKSAWGVVAAVKAMATSFGAFSVAGFFTKGLIAAEALASFLITGFAKAPFVIASAFTTVSTVVKTAGAAMYAALGPVGLAVAGVAAGAALIYANWDKIGPWAEETWGKVASIVTDAWDSVCSSVDEAASWIRDLWDSMMDLEFSVDFEGTLNAVEEGVSALAGEIVSIFPASWGEAFETVKANALGWIEELKQLFSGFDFSSLVPDFAKGLFGMDDDSDRTVARQDAPIRPGAVAYDRPQAVQMAGGTMSGYMAIDVFGNDANVAVRDVQSSDNLTITGSVGRSNRSGGD